MGNWNRHPFIQQYKSKGTFRSCQWEWGSGSVWILLSMDDYYFINEFIHFEIRAIR